MRNRELDRPSPGFGLARALGLILNYFVGHQYVYPVILSTILSYVDPQAVVYPLWALALWYSTTLLITLFLAWPLIKESWSALSHRFKSTVKITMGLFPVMYFASIGLSMLIGWLSGQATSGNQTSLNELLGKYPAFTLLLTVVFAPIVEELVFRGAFYRYFRAKGQYWFPMILSASAFAMIHLSLALSQGHWGELWFFPLYGMLGVFLSVAYEKTGTIFGSVFLHFIYNAVGMLIALIAR
jgi:membrane protease YdiL (CAAX protease family)